MSIFGCEMFDLAMVERQKATSEKVFFKATLHICFDIFREICDNIFFDLCLIFLLLLTR